MRSRLNSYRSSQSVRAGGRKFIAPSITCTNGGQNALGPYFAVSCSARILAEEDDLPKAFYQDHHFENVTVFDPFMGSGTTVGEAHKLGITALGRDINPVAFESVCTALGPMEQRSLKHAFHELSQECGKRIRALYRSKDAIGRPCDVLYFFWVMQVHCLKCQNPVDLFPSWIIARNAYPQRKPEVQILCPGMRGHLSRASQTSHRDVPIVQYAIRSPAWTRTRSKGNLPPLRPQVYDPRCRSDRPASVRHSGFTASLCSREMVPKTTYRQRPRIMRRTRIVRRSSSEEAERGQHPPSHASSRTWLQHAASDEL